MKKKKLGDYSIKTPINNQGTKILPIEIIEFINIISNGDDVCKLACISTANELKKYYEKVPKQRYKKRINVLRTFNDVCNQFPNHTRAEQIRKTGLLMGMTERAVSKHVYKE